MGHNKAKRSLNDPRGELSISSGWVSQTYRLSCEELVITSLLVVVEAAREEL
jgi:hypothetical protein